MAETCTEDRVDELARRKAKEAADKVALVAWCESKVADVHAGLSAFLPDITAVTTLSVPAQHCSFASLTLPVTQCTQSILERQDAW